MDISSITATAGMDAAVRQVQAATEAQLAVMAALAESQRQMAQMLAAAGVGQNIDIRV